MYNEKGKLKKEIMLICEKIKNNMEKYGEAYPDSAACNGRYLTIENREWTNSFWTGMLFIAYEFTGDNEFLKRAEINCESFISRLKNMYKLDHHDIGFLYTLSLVAGYKVTGNQRYRKYGIIAADELCKRYNEIGRFIAAWSDDKEDLEQRAIIDSLLNIPILYWAFEETKDDRYKSIADNHAKTILDNIIREDNTTFHTYYFNKNTGQPLYGKTRQGYSDDSCWSRGQAWAIYGTALMEKYHSVVDTRDIYFNVKKVFEENLPSDNVAYWDFYFNDNNPSDKDTSATAIALCGIVQKMNNDEMKQFDNNFMKMFKGLMSYQVTDINEEGILSQGVYSWHSNKGVNEPNIWGDYYFLELLYRLYNRRWNGYF